MTSTEYEIQYMTDESISGIFDRWKGQSPSTVSDCYSNDEPYIYDDYNQSNDEVCDFKSNLFSDFNNEHGMEECYRNMYSDVIENDFSKDDKIDDMHSSLESLDSGNTEITTYNQIYSDNLHHVLLDQGNSSRCYMSPSIPNETHSGPSLFRMIDDCSSVTLNSKQYDLERNSSREPTHLHFDIQRIEDETLGRGENTISNSLFDFSKKTEDSNFCTVVESIKSSGNRNKTFFRSIISQDSESVSKYVNLTDSARKIIPIKNVSNYSTKNEISQERSTQTRGSIVYKEKSVGANKCRKGTEVHRTSFEEIMSRQVRSHPTIDLSEKFLDKESQKLNVDKAIAILKLHLHSVLANIDQRYPGDISSSLDFVASGRPKYCESDVRDLYNQISEMYTLFDCKIKSGLSKNLRHQRCNSEDTKNKPHIRGSGDIVIDHEAELASMQNDSQMETKRSRCFTNSAPEYAQMSTGARWACRTFELNAYDDIIKSYQCNSDRRIKAVCNKMKCKIFISGPIRIFDSTDACWNVRNKTEFRCSITGPSGDSVEKCLKCLQDTFPQSCLNERHQLGTTENKANV